MSSGQLEKWNRLLDSAKPEQLIFEDVEGEENGAEGVDLDVEEVEDGEGENDLDGDDLAGDEEEVSSEIEEASPSASSGSPSASSGSPSASSGSNCSEDWGRDKTSAYR